MTYVVYHRYDDFGCFRATHVSASFAPAGKSVRTFVAPASEIGIGSALGWGATAGLAALSVYLSAWMYWVGLGFH